MSVSPHEPTADPLAGERGFGDSLASSLNVGISQPEMRKFPDEETYLRLRSDVDRQSIVVVCSLDRPNDKMLSLLFLAATARELGARRIGLVSPNLAYMRQDRRFTPGEAVTSREIARLISGSFDWLVTVDPHLHRYGSLAEIYDIPTQVIHAAPLISRWVRDNVSDGLIIGPDSESEQWVSSVAADAGLPYSVLHKMRRGDRDVEITVRDAGRLAGRTPVLVDDIISSGATMIEAIRSIGRAASAAPMCIAVHGIFANNSDAALAAAGARVATVNCIAHPTNSIDITPLLVPAIRDFI